MKEQLSWQNAQESISDLPEVVQIPSNNQNDEIQSSSGHLYVPKHSQEHGASQDWAATKIQAVFRGYLVSFFIDSLFFIKMGRKKKR